MKKKQLLKFIWMFFYLFIFSMLLWNSFGYLDNDLGWHLKVGEEFVTKHEIPYNEHFNYTLEGEKWIDHEWLIDVFSFSAPKALFAKIFFKKCHRRIFFNVFSIFRNKGITSTFGS